MTALFLFIVGAVGYVTFFPSGLLSITENKEDKEIFLPPGYGLMGLTDVLIKEKILKHPYGFILLCILRDKMKSLQAGEYFIPAQTTLKAVLHKISTGDIIHRAFSVIEGVTVVDVVQKLNDNNLLTGTVSEIPKEGYLLPATYPYHRGESRQQLLLHMKHAMEVSLLELWKNRPKDCLLKTPEEALILASIIEKETSQILKEQPRIAGVFYNRMKKKMRLQSDPTVIYGITLGKKPLGRSLTREDLEHASPYNTYRHLGLPPTPICCPRKEAIQAALHHHDHEEFYFVANGTGGHSFAKTLDEHNKNVQKWREIKTSNAIK